VPHPEGFTGKKGSALNNLLSRSYHQARYSFVWFFYMIKGNWFPLTLPNRFTFIFPVILITCRNVMKRF